MKLVFDTYAWVEYFKGEDLGKKVEAYLNDKGNEIVTPSIVLIELSCKAAREHLDFEKMLEFIKVHSLMFGLNEAIIKECGKVYAKQRTKDRKFSMVDAVILTTAIHFVARVVTGDEHFRNINEALMLK